MAKGTIPYVPIYIGDYYKSDIQLCSMAARGLMTELRLIMAQSERYGYLVKDNKPMTMEYIASKSRSTPSEVAGLLTQLVSVGLVKSTDSGIQYDPQLVETNRLRTLRAKGGELGGNPRLKKKVNLMVNRKVNQNGNEMKCNEVVVKSNVVSVDLPPPLTPPPKSPVHRLVKAWAVILGIPPDDREAWNKANWPRCAKSAKLLTEIFRVNGAGDDELAPVVDCMQEQYEQGKRGGYDVTLETVARKASEWRVKNGLTTAQA